MKLIYIFIACALTINAQAQLFKSISLSAGPAIPVNDYGDDKPAAYQGFISRIEGYHYFTKNMLLGIGLECQKISAKFPYKVNDTATSSYQELTYLAIPVTFYNEAITVHKGVVPFLSIGTNMMFLVNSSSSGRSLEPMPIVFCGTAGAGLKFNFSDKLNASIKGNFNQNINYALRVDQTRVTTFSLSAAVGIRLN